MQYNTSQQELVMPEYGRHIQSMVDYIRTIPEKEKRQKNAESIIELMGVLNPHLKNVEDFRHKLWDHLFLIADFDLDIDSPYPVPTRDKFLRKPDPLSYPVKFRERRHLGKNIQKIIRRAIEETNEEKKKGFTNSIAYYMKLAYANWSRESVPDDVIKDELAEITNGALNYTEGGIKIRFDAHRQHSHKKGGGKNLKNRGPVKNNRKNNRKS